MRPLVSAHLALMRAYRVVLKHAAFPPYSWQSIGKAPAGPTLRMAGFAWLKGARPFPQFVRRRGGLWLNSCCCLLAFFSLKVWS